MTPAVSRSKTKPKRATRKRVPERRRAPRGNFKLLTAFRCLDADQETRTGFVRSLNLSEVGALLESPDEFAVGEKLGVEFLLDNNRIAQADVRVTRVTRQDPFYHIAVEFVRVSPQARRLIDKQIALTR
jgi:c-di-GMP-binding flagellar brake protein YcgR